MSDVLILGDTERSAALRHELPLGIGDPFLYAEVGGVRHVVISSLEVPRIAELPGPYAIHPFDELGIDELLASGCGRDAALLEVHSRAVRALGVRRALVPAEFPLEAADRLRADGVELIVDRELFNGRRRVKSEAEVAGVRRAQRGTVRRWTLHGRCSGPRRRERTASFSSTARRSPASACGSPSTRRSSTTASSPRRRSSRTARRLRSATTRAPVRSARTSPSCSTSSRATARAAASPT